MSNRKEERKFREELDGMSEEFYEYGTMTKFDFDRIQYSLQFADRCKRDGILTYERDCNELRKILLPFDALIELLESMPKGEILWSIAIDELKKMQSILKEMK